MFKKEYMRSFIKHSKTGKAISESNNKHFISWPLIVILTIICLIPTQELNAQKRSYFGTRVSFDLSIPRKGWGLYKTGSGLQGGVIYNYSFNNHVFIEPGIELVYTTMGIKDIVEDDKYYEGSARNLSFRIPVNIGYRWMITPDFQLAAMTGPWLNISLMAREYLTPNFEGPIKKGSFDLFDTSGWKRVDLQWGIGLCVSYMHKYTLEFQFGYGLTPLATGIHEREGGEKHTLHRNTFAITLGYNF